MPRKPSKTKATTKQRKAVKEAKRKVVVAGIVAGKERGQIARDAGCTERHVSRLAAEPETQFLIADTLKPHRVKLAKLAGTVVAAIEGALVAEKDDTADHIVRLRAVERYNDVIEAAQGQLPEATEDKGPPMLQWEDFLVLYRRYRETRGADAQN